MSVLSRLVPGFIRRRYLAKFVISILVVTLAIASVGVVSYAQVNDTVSQDAREDIESTAELQANTIGDWTETMRVQTRSISASQPLREGETQDVQAHLVEEQARMSVDVRAIHYVDTDSGEVVTSTDRDLRGESIDDVDEPWTEAQFQEELTFDDDVWNTDRSYESASLDDQVMAFASPVNDRDDRVVVIIGTLEYRVDQLDQPTAAASTSIVDEDGEPVLRGGDDSFDESGLDESSIEAALGGRVSVTDEGDFVRAYVPVGDTHWVAVTSVPAGEAYGVADAVGQNVLAIVVVGLLSLGLVGVVLGRQTVIPLTRLRDRTEQMEQGNLDVDLETDRVDEIGRLFTGFDSMRTSLKTQIGEAEEARVEAERARAESEGMTRHLERKADEYSGVMADCAEGDLTRRLDPESESEAMTEIARSFNEMIDQLEATTHHVKGFATEVATASEEVTASSEEVRSAGEQVSESIQEISDGAEQQNENLRSVSAEMESLSTTTEEIAASSNAVADIAERTAKTGYQGREAAQQAIDGMHEIERESTDAVEAIQDLEAEMEQIDELVEFISDVARETNMLALNANIEASRGGGGDGRGEGFAVVANQVKELAADTKKTAEDIEARLERIDDQTERTAAEVQRTAKRISRHVDSVENAAQALDEIASYAEQTNDGVQEISAASEEQAASTQEVVAMVSSATDISDRTAAEAEQVAAAAEEQTSALTEVSRSANSLATRAGHLSEALDRFETQGDDESAPDDRAIDLDRIEEPDPTGVEAGEPVAERDVDLSFDESIADEPIDDAGYEPVANVEEGAIDGEEDRAVRHDDPRGDANDDGETRDDGEADTESGDETTTDDTEDGPFRFGQNTDDE